MGIRFLENREIMDHEQQQLSNEEKYLEIMKRLDPEMFLVKIALEQTGINPIILPRIIRSLANLNIGTGYGEVTLLVKDRILTQIKGSESDVPGIPIDKLNENSRI